MRMLLICIVILSSIAINAQVTSVSLQASGLTCSMCSNSINKALKTLSFVSNINPNIQTSNFEINFKQNRNVDFDAIKMKVEEAGFSVANFVATINFKNVELKPDEAVTTAGKTFYFLNVKEQLLNGPKQVRLINKGFLSNKEYKKNAAAIPATNKGIYYATFYNSEG